MIVKGKKEVYTLRYVDFIMPMVKAIQEQQEQTTNYKSQIANLQSQLSSQQNEIEKINNYLEMKTKR